MSDRRPRIRQGPIAPKGMPHHAYMITMNPVTVIFLTPKRRSSHHRLAVNQEKSRLTTMEEGFAFLGPEFRKTPVRWSYMWARGSHCMPSTQLANPRYVFIISSWLSNAASLRRAPCTTGQDSDTHCRGPVPR